MPDVVLMITHAQRMLSKLDSTEVITPEVSLNLGRLIFPFVLNCLYPEGPSVVSKTRYPMASTEASRRLLKPLPR